MHYCTHRLFILRQNGSWYQVYITGGDEISPPPWDEFPSRFCPEHALRGAPTTNMAGLASSCRCLSIDALLGVWIVPRCGGSSSERVCYLSPRMLDGMGLLVKPALPAPYVSLHDDWSICTVGCSASRVPCAAITLQYRA